MQGCGNTDPMNYGTFWPGLFSSLLSCAPCTCILFNLPDIYKIDQRISCIYGWLYVSTTLATCTCICMYYHTTCKIALIHWNNVLLIQVQILKLMC